MHYKIIQEGHMCNLLLEKDLKTLPQVAPFIMTAPRWIDLTMCIQENHSSLPHIAQGTRIKDAKDMAFGCLKSHCPKTKSPNIFSIYVQAMEILSTNIFALTHVTNPPYHQTISCSN
jgi:hypothetical protein